MEILCQRTCIPGVISSPYIEMIFWNVGAPLAGALDDTIVRNNRAGASPAPTVGISLVPCREKSGGLMLTRVEVKPPEAEVQPLLCFIKPTSPVNSA